jgi:hypothetical protein
MAKSTDANPTGFNQVPPHLEARNFLQHIEKFTNNRRAQNTYAKSKNRYKFRKLCQNVKTWSTNPDPHLRAMKTAWYEWNIAGIKEINDKPGTYLFMRAILTDSEDSEESEASHKLSAAIDKTTVSHQSPRKMTGNTADLTDGISITAGTDSSKPDVPNPFFSLAKDTQSPRTWAQRARKANQPPADAASTESVTPIDSESVNLLETSASEIETQIETHPAPPHQSTNEDLAPIILELKRGSDGAPLHHRGFSSMADPDDSTTCKSQPRCHQSSSNP